MYRKQFILRIMRKLAINKCQLHAYLTQAEHKALKEIADESEESLSAAIARLIRNASPQYHWVDENIDRKKTKDINIISESENNW